MPRPTQCTCTNPYTVTCEFCMSLENMESPNFMTDAMWRTWDATNKTHYHQPTNAQQVDALKTAESLEKKGSN